VAVPLPGSRVIHPRWSEHHRPTSTAAFTAECVITRATGAGTTDADGVWTPSPDGDPPVYAGGCRAVPLSTDQGRFRVSGETQATPRRYYISVEYDAATVLVGDIVTFTASQDTGMVEPGLKVRVTDIRYGSEQWQRDLLAEEIQ
jgi:hypothetical protein